MDVVYISSDVFWPLLVIVGLVVIGVLLISLFASMSTYESQRQSEHERRVEQVSTQRQIENERLAAQIYAQRQIENERQVAQIRKRGDQTRAEVEQLTEQYMAKMMKAPAELRRKMNAAQERNQS